MKTLILSLLVLALCPAVFAQSDAPIRARLTRHGDGTLSNTVTDLERRVIEETLLDSNGKAIRKIVYPLDDRDLPRGYIIHDAKGNVVSKSRYERDHADRITQETIMSAAGHVLRRRVYSYDGNNKVTGIDEYDAKGNLIPRVAKASPARPDKKRR